VRVGILTGGGDCPGLNAVIRGVVRAGVGLGQEHLGLLRGWKGLLEADVRPLDVANTSGIRHRGGTILGSSRTNPFSLEGGGARAAAAAREIGLDALVAIGGEDTLGVANRLHAEFDFPVVGVPKTIDNDLSGTDYTFGFWTAVQIAVDALDRLHTTAESHDRVLVVEVMGRHAGWIALESGLAGGADAVLIPEVPTSVERVCEHITARAERGSRFSLIVVSEGVQLDEVADTGEVDQFGHTLLARAGVGDRLAARISDALGVEARAVVLGHVQRGGTPIAYDRSLASRFGVQAARMVAAGHFGRMAALRGATVVDVPLAEAVGTLKTVPPEAYALAQIFFG
jgi:ATP-dependent phosphofructokinase / diphosphate-dependent phosphofructokinase